MSFPELTPEYWFKKGIEFSKDPYFFKAARMSLVNALYSEDSEKLTFAQREEARETLKKIKTKV